MCIRDRLNRFRNESWASDALDMMYLDDERLAWAKATGDHDNDSSVDLHRDCNGATLNAGDTVVPVSYTHLDVYKRQIYILYQQAPRLDSKRYLCGYNALRSCDAADKVCLELICVTT